MEVGSHIPDFRAARAKPIRAHRSTCSGLSAPALSRAGAERHPLLANQEGHTLERHNPV